MCKGPVIIIDYEHHKSEHTTSQLLSTSQLASVKGNACAAKKASLANQGLYCM